MTKPLHKQIDFWIHQQGTQKLIDLVRRQVRRQIHSEIFAPINELIYWRIVDQIRAFRTVDNRGQTR